METKIDYWENIYIKINILEGDGNIYCHTLKNKFVWLKMRKNPEKNPDFEGGGYPKTFSKSTNFEGRGILKEGRVFLVLRTD